MYAVILLDLDYFKKYIAPTVEKCLDDVDVTVYYLWLVQKKHTNYY